MIDARRIFEDLKRQASELAREANVDDRLNDAKAAVDKVKARLETDPKARNVAAGAGGVLLLGLLGTKGGRGLLGGIAKTGVVAAAGALAYNAWAKRQGKTPGEASPQALKDAGFLIDADADEEFAGALLHAMLGAAYADGTLDKRERIAIEAALVRSGASDEERRQLMNDLPERERLALIAKGAKTPNHAAELYAAAAMTANDGAPEAAFLEKLADALNLDREHAAALREQAA